MHVSKILVGTDLSERSDRAVRRALHLAKEHNATLKVLHVVDDELPATIAREVRDFATEDLRDLVKKHQPDFSSEQFEIDVRFGAIAPTILEYERELAADLIVLGTHRFRGLSELFRGTTLDRVTRTSIASVLMVHADSTLMYRNILIGIDFSPASRGAFMVASALAPEACLSFLSAFHVPFKHFIDRAEPGGADVRAEKHGIERDLDMRMVEFKSGLSLDTASVKAKYVEGGAAESLCRYAVEENSDLIAIGSHGRSWLADAVLGSTARDLLHSAPCDVLIAKPK